MNYVFISPYFPDQFKYFCQELKNAGATVLGLGDNSFHNLSDELKSSLTEYYKVSDLHNYDELVRALGYFTYKYGKINRIDSLNEYWLETEAKLRTDFNIAGINMDQIENVRKKSKMKEVFKKAGIKVAAGEIITSEKSAKEFIKKYGYPVVAKPDAGVGALGTYKINNATDLKKFFETKLPSEYIMEEYISGTIYSFDGLVDKSGNIIFYTSHKYGQGIMETVNEDKHIVYYSLRKIPVKLEKAGRKVVQAFAITERFFHLEFFLTPENEFVALEVNMRPPGGYTTDMFNFANDFNIYQIWADLIVHNKTEIAYDRKYHCGYASRKFSINYKYSHHEVLAKYDEHISHHAHIAGVFRSALGDYGYIFRTENEKQIQEIADFIHATN
jgi:biotin carboxylase